jgi:hypothetical protein
VRRRNTPDKGDLEGEGEAVHQHAGQACAGVAAAFVGGVVEDVFALAGDGLQPITE